MATKPRKAAGKSRAAKKTGRRAAKPRSAPVRAHGQAVVADGVGVVLGRRRRSLAGRRSAKPASGRQQENQDRHGKREANACASEESRT